jgi:nucleotide-binding universal stress UspA family protein
MSRREGSDRGPTAPHINGELRAQLYAQTRVPEPARAPDEQVVDLTTDVLVEASAPSPPTNRIVVGVDGSAGAHAALMWAAAEARQRGAELVVAQAWVPQGPMVGPMLAPGNDLWAETIELSRENLTAQIEQVRGPDLEVTPQVVGGPAARALEALSADADLVVVGSHGRGAIGRTFLGSVSSHLCRYAQCPVVVVPEDSSSG